MSFCVSGVFKTLFSVSFCRDFVSFESHGNFLYFFLLCCLFSGRFVSLSIHFESLCIHFVSLSIYSVSLSIHFVSLSINFV